MVGCSSEKKQKFLGNYYLFHVTFHKHSEFRDSEPSLLAKIRTVALLLIMLNVCSNYTLGRKWHKIMI